MVMGRFIDWREARRDGFTRTVLNPAPVVEEDARAATARADGALMAAQGQELDVEWWGLLQFADGHVDEKPAKYAAVIEEWKHANPKRYELIGLWKGTPPPWRVQQSAPAPAVPATLAVPAPVSADAVPDGSSGGFRRLIPPTTESSPALRDSNEPPAAAPPAPAAGAAPASASPEEVIEQALALLAQDEDLRVRRHASRIKQHRDEVRAGVRLSKRDRASLQKPF